MSCCDRCGNPVLVVAQLPEATEQDHEVGDKGPGGQKEEAVGEEQRDRRVHTTEGIDGGDVEFVVRQGSIQKRGQTLTAFKTRFLVLYQSGLFEWYLQESDRQALRAPQGKASVRRASKLHKPEKYVQDAWGGHEQDGFLFQVVVSDDEHKLRVIEFACETEAQRDAWMNALNSVCSQQGRVKETIPLIDIVKVRIMRGNAEEDVLDLGMLARGTEADAASAASPTAAAVTGDGDAMGAALKLGMESREKTFRQGLKPGSRFSTRQAIKLSFQAPESQTPGSQKEESGEEAVDWAADKLLVQEDVPDADSFYVMEIHAASGDGCTSVIWFRASNQELLFHWAEEINRYARAGKHVQSLLSKSAFQRMQDVVRAWYISNPVQILVAILIFANFIINAAQSELLPEPGTSEDMFFTMFDNFFTACFTAELIVNLVANWFWPFFTDAWALFDLVVVFVSLLALIAGDMPGVNTLRLMRAFRVVRLFGRLESLRQIIDALSASMLPVGNALLIMLLITRYRVLQQSAFRLVLAAPVFT